MTHTRTFFDDGEHYDALHAGLRDIDFWVRHARQVGGSVLELACGTGRIAIPMGETGLPVTGIDLSDVYISRARLKSAERGLNVTFEVADVRCFDLGRVFRFVAFPFRSVGVLLADEDLHSCCAHARRHIETGGVFIVDAINSSKTATAPFPAQLCYPNPDGSGTISVEHERYVDGTGRIETSVFSFPHSVAGVRARAELRLRLYTADELVAALRANGFEVLRHLGGYDESPYTEASSLQILVAEAV